MLILKFRKYNNSLYKLSSDFQIVTVLGLQFIIFILQQLHNLITTALVNSNLYTNPEVNNRLSDETLELNKCLSVRSRDQVTDCMIEICQASCHTKAQVTKR